MDSRSSPIDTFYNALNVNDHDYLNSAASGEYKSFHLQSISSPDVVELKDMVRALLLGQAETLLVTASRSRKKRGCKSCVTCWDYKSSKAHSDPVIKDYSSGIRATKGTLHKIEHRSKPFIPPNQIIMSQPANDNFSLHDDEKLSLHDDASLDGSVPASTKGDASAKPPQIITTNTLSNIKLQPIFQTDDLCIRGRWRWNIIL
ncbi:hypothetical protein Tco_1185669 [Tanacetum coccineum]